MRKLTSLAEDELIESIIQLFCDTGVSLQEVLTTVGTGYVGWLEPPCFLPEGILQGGSFKPSGVSFSGELSKLRSWLDTAAEVPDNQVALVVAHTLNDLIAYNLHEQVICTNNTYLLTMPGTVRRIGIANGDIEGLLCSRKLNLTVNLQDTLMQSGEPFCDNTFNLIDRCKVWLDQYFDVIPDAETLLIKLSLLKVCGTPRCALKFEHAMWDRVFRGEKQIDSTLFYTSCLDEIRDLWGHSTGNIEDDVRKLYDKLVPIYLDEDMWLKIFKHYPPERPKIFSKTQARTVEAGFEGFLTWFLEQQRRAKEAGKEIN